MIHEQHTLIYYTFFYSCPIFLRKKIIFYVSMFIDVLSSGSNFKLKFWFNFDIFSYYKISIATFLRKQMF